MSINLEECHFIGIGGIGMSGLARILIQKQSKVSGSDVLSTPLTASLAKAGVTLFEGHAHTPLSSNMTVIYSSSIKPDNREYQEAKRLNCALLHRSDLLVQLTAGYKTLAITGTHGKTTTSALLTAVLIEAGQEPSFAVGGLLTQFQTNAAHAKGTYFVAEADESDGTFLKYDPWAAIVTSIDGDHLDHFESEEALVSAFKSFMQKVKDKEQLFCGAEDQHLAQLQLPGISYGFNPTCQLKISNFYQRGWQTFFDLEFETKQYRHIELNLTGRHNVLNAAAVFGLALTLKVEEKSIRCAFKQFEGVLRRCEKKGAAGDYLFR